MYESECFRPRVSSVKRQIPSVATFFPAVCHSDAMQPLRSDHVISLDSLIVYVNDLILNTNWSRRGKNLQEILSPTNQTNPDNDDSDDNDDAGDGNQDGASEERWNGSYHCKLYINSSGSKCDVCSYMEETSYVTSLYFKRKFAIHGRNIHLPASMKKKLTWFVYLVNDNVCHLQYVGSTTDPCSRWSGTKGACQGRKLTNTGLYKHFSDGCNEHIRTGNVRHLTWTLVDFMKTSEERLNDAGHKGGVACRCSECQRLKDIEDKWICRLGTFNPPHGLNSRDEIKARSRVNFLKQNNL